LQELEATRYERTSELIKAFKHSCSRVREEFHSLEMELPEFSAVLDEMTENTYVLIIVHDPTIGARPSVLPLLTLSLLPLCT
jgi:Ras-related GTP-binding protein A/B